MANEIFHPKLVGTPGKYTCDMCDTIVCYNKSLEHESSNRFMRRLAKYLFGVFPHPLALCIRNIPLRFPIKIQVTKSTRNLLWILSVLSQCHKVYDCDSRQRSREDFGMQAIFNWMQFLTTTEEWSSSRGERPVSSANIFYSLRKFFTACHQSFASIVTAVTDNRMIYVYVNVSWIWNTTDTFNSNVFCMQMICGIHFLNYL